MDIYDKDKFIEYLSKVRKYLRIREVEFDDNTTVNQVFTQIAKNVKEEIDSKSLSHFTVLKYLEKLRTLHLSQNESLSDLIQKLKPIKEDKIEPSKKYLINDFKNNTGIIEIDYVYDIKVLKDVKEKLDEELYKSVKEQPFINYKKLYAVKDQLVDDKKESEDEENKKGSKRDNLIRHLFKIQHTLLYYENKNFSEFFRIIKKNGIRINSIEEKIKLKEAIEKLLKNRTTTIGEVIDRADELGIVIKNDKSLNEFIKSSEYIYTRVREVSYQEFINLYNYLEGFTPYSTQHKTKGSEYDNVLIVLDNGNWPKYNFKYLFENTKDKEEIIERTQKLFYVCCTRAKENLAVYYLAPSEKVLETAKKWFGVSIIDLDKL
ncbi:3'-5' exonuclease [Flavobacterium sp. XS1P32]|uniref:3'-5' exonuclease n=1 Tax=unclassified Flavobacterium TaxID=196869 RepID=UPI003AB02D73